MKKLTFGVLILFGWAIINSCSTSSERSAASLSDDNITFPDEHSARVNNFNYDSARVAAGYVPTDSVAVSYTSYPVVLEKALPRYPEIALRARLDGSVVVKVWVWLDGRPLNAVLLRSDAAVFDRAALLAALHSRFAPAVQGGKPVPQWGQLVYTFKSPNVY